MGINWNWCFSYLLSLFWIIFFFWNIYIWISIIFAYYLIATLLPIDKLIGKLYPIFGILLVAMAVAILVAFVIYKPDMPELWQGLGNKHPHADTNPIFPMMFISIACGAISGFHATQSPLMARCMVNEKQGRPIFYGAMITEGVVALIWAAAATVFYHNPELQPLTINPATGQQFGGNAMVGIIANKWFPPIVATITIIGVICAAITSGDTALRSARLIVADFLKYDQKPIKNRLLISIPIFLLTTGLLVFSLTDEKGFDIIWRYFAWSNQVLAMVTLWAITIYLVKNKKIFMITLVPALFMTMVCCTFILISQSGGLGLRPIWAYSISGLLTLDAGAIFVFWLVKNRKQNIKTEKE